MARTGWTIDKLKRLPTILGVLLVLLAAPAVAEVAPQVVMPVPVVPQTIVPGAVWRDDLGEPIQAHGGGVIQVGDTFYWYGEDRAPSNPKDMRAVSGYSSKDLVHWTHLGQVLQVTNPVVERPKVYYNAKTKTWVMYVHLDGPLPYRDGYALASVGVYVSESPAGPFREVAVFRPLGCESRDIGQFIDDDGTAYLIFEDRPRGFHIAKLTDDYVGVEKDACLVPEHLEGGALARVNDLYYVVASHLSGWAPNANVYATATSLAGPWSPFKNIAPPETKTYSSQSSMLLKVQGTKTTTVIYMGDQWRPGKLSDSRYLWMPLTMANGKATLPKPGPWTIDVATGEATLLAGDMGDKVAGGTEPTATK